MTAQRGTGAILGIQRGGTQYVRVQRGSTVMWSLNAGVFDDFIRLDGDGVPVDTLNTMGDNWTVHDDSPDYRLGIEDGNARVSVADMQIGGFWSLRTCLVRWNVGVNPGDDGFVSCRASSRGNGASLTSLGGYVTQVVGRMSNAAFSHGVMMHMNAGNVWIARLVSNSWTLMANGGSFQAGDELRLDFTGNYHQLRVNGDERTDWNDTGATAAKGVDYRSLGLRADGAKDLFGPRRFSPAIDWVRMG